MNYISFVYAVQQNSPSQDEIKNNFRTVRHNGMRTVGAGVDIHPGGEAAHPEQDLHQGAEVENPSSRASLLPWRRVKS